MNLISLIFFLEKITHFEQKYHFLFYVFTLSLKIYILILQENKNDIFIKIIPKIKDGSYFKIWVFKSSFNQITLVLVINICRECKHS